MAIDPEILDKVLEEMPDDEAEQAEETPQEEPVKEEPKPEVPKQEQPLQQPADDGRPYSTALTPEAQLATRAVTSVIIDEIIRNSDKFLKHFEKLKGFDPSQSFHITQVSNSDTISSTADGKVTMLKSKSDICVLQGKFAWGIKLIQGMGGKAIFGDWSLESLKKHIPDITKLVDKYLTKPEEIKAGELEKLHKYFVNDPGRKFIIDNIIKLQKDGVVTKTEHLADYVLIVRIIDNSVKPIDLLETQDYVDVLVTVGAGTFGSGVVVTSNNGKRFIIRQV